LFWVRLKAGTEEGEDSRRVRREGLLAVGARDREGGRGGVGPVEDGHGLDDTGFVFEGGAPPAEFVEEDA
jgi:hypothetical protein